MTQAEKERRIRAFVDWAGDIGGRPLLILLIIMVAPIAWIRRLRS